MRFRDLLVGIILSLSLLPSWGWSQRACVEMFSPSAVVGKNSIAADGELAQKILQFMDLLGAGNTTSLRQEDKYVVSAETVDRVLGTLIQQHGTQFQLRDQKQEGRKNVTVTQYALPFKWKDAQGKNIAAKIRFRKYFDTDSSVALGQAAGRPADIVKERQFVEFKIDHPQFPQVVIKPRMLMLDADAETIQNQKEFLKNKEAILARTLEINPKTSPEVVGQFFEILSIVFSEPIEKLPLLAKTAYVRDSYSLMLKDLEGKPVEVQLTVDREINVLDSRTQQVVSAYRPEDIVVELKVPLAYSALTPQVLQQVPGLSDVLSLKEDLQKNHVQLYTEGSGKLSTFKKARVSPPSEKSRD
jgi:hypothetical protein